MVFGQIRMPWARRRETAARHGRDANSVWRSCHGVQSLALSRGRTLSGTRLSPAAPSPPD